MGRSVISCCRTCVLSFHENNEQTEQVARVKMEKPCLLAASWEVTSPTAWPSGLSGPCECDGQGCCSSPWVAPWFGGKWETLAS